MTRAYTPRRNTTRSELFKVMQLLTENGVSTEVDGKKRYEYNYDWSDSIIADKTGVPKAIVSVIRNKEFGLVRSFRPKKVKEFSNTQFLQSVVATQDARLKAIELWLENNFEFKRWGIL